MPVCLQNGIPIANAVANVAFNKANKVVSFGSSFVKPCALRCTTGILSSYDAADFLRRSQRAFYCPFYLCC